MQYAQKIKKIITGVFLKNFISLKMKIYTKKINDDKLTIKSGKNGPEINRGTIRDTIKGILYLLIALYFIIFLI
jgi:hypothetical protein|tara:strand:- start:215 stop:436 length:222 start_codon:yes stop_codon:yes gene_type:complete